MKKRLLSSLFAFGLLSLLLVQQIALLPFAQTASAQPTTLSTTKVETYEQKARKYALTRAVGQCLSELDDSTSIHDSWDDNFGQTDAGDNINVGLLVAPGSGVMECGEVMPTALNEFGYGDTPGGRQEFFTDLGAKCDSSGNNCGDYKDFADLENNMANVAKKKGIPTQQTDDIRLPELWKTAQQACSLSPQPVYESVDSPEAKAANITNAISSNTGRYIVYYSIGADSSGLPILTSPVYQFEDGSDAGLWHYTGGYGDDGDNLGDNSLLSIPASEAIVGADFAALNLADADTGCNYLAEYINKKSAAAAGEQLKAVKKESDAAASAAFVSTVIDQIAPLAGCQKPSGDITSPAGIRQKEEYDNCVDNKGIRAAVTNCLSPLSATKLDDAQKKTIASCISAKLKLDLGAVTTAVNNGANAATAAAAGVVQASLTNTSTQGTASDNSCGINAQGFGDRALSWFACPLSAGLADFARFLGSEVADFLYINPQQTFSEGAEKAAKTFRNLGLALVIIAGLAMVISQAIGLEIFDAYTIRKLMPRLLIALVGIAVSWPLLRFVVDLFNDLGVGVRSLILGPFSEFGTNYSELGTLAGGAASIGSTLLEWLIAIVATGGIGIALGWAGIGLMLLSIILALLIAFVVLGVRQAVVLMAVVMAPLAIAAYVLPGTQKVWSFWKNTIITALVMFPIVTGLLAATEALSRVMMKNDDQFLAIVVFFAGYAAIPTAFKMAGGLIATIANFGQQRTGGLFGALKKGRGERMNANIGKVKGGNRFRTTSRMGNAFNTRSKAAYDATQTIGLTRRSRAERREAYHANHGFHVASDIRKQHGDMMSDDGINRAILESDGTLGSVRANLAAAGYEGHRLVAATGTAERLLATGSRQDVMTAIALHNVSTGSGYKNQQHMMDTIANVAGENTELATKMLGAMRGEAKQVGRSDLVARFGAQNDVLIDEINRRAGHQNNGGTISADNMRDLALSSFNQTDVATIARDRHESVRAHTKAMQARIEILRTEPDKLITMDDNTTIKASDLADSLTAQLQNLTASTREYGALDRAHVAHGTSEAIGQDGVITGTKKVFVKEINQRTGVEEIVQKDVSEYSPEYEAHISRYGTIPGSTNDPNMQQPQQPKPPEE